MRRLRQHVAGIVGAWLLCQASAMILVPVSLCASESALEQACTCDHNDGQECPMHHTKSKSPATCSCRSTADGPTAVLASLLGPTAILTPRTTVVETVAPSGLWTAPDVLLFDASINPDPPPPRA